MSKIPLHQRINWPEWVDMENLFYAIYRFSYMRLDGAGLPINIVKGRFYMRRNAIGKYKIDNDLAAMWYAVMKTAIERYGLKP